MYKISPNEWECRDCDYTELTEKAWAQEMAQQKFKEDYNDLSYQDKQYIIATIHRLKSNPSDDIIVPEFAKKEDAIGYAIHTEKKAAALYDMMGKKFPETAGVVEHIEKEEKQHIKELERIQNPSLGGLTSSQEIWEEKGGIKSLENPQFVMCKECGRKSRVEDYTIESGYDQLCSHCGQYLGIDETEDNTLQIDEDKKENPIEFKLTNDRYELRVEHLPGKLGCKFEVYLIDKEKGRSGALTALETFDSAVEYARKFWASELKLKENPDVSVPFKVKVKSNKSMGEYIALHGLVPGNELPDRFKGKIPENEIWIRKDVYADKKRGKAVLSHEKNELIAMTQQKATYKVAHQKAERMENPRTWWDNSDALSAVARLNDVLLYTLPIDDFNDMVEQTIENMEYLHTKHGFWKEDRAEKWFWESVKNCGISKDMIKPEYHAEYDKYNPAGTVSAAPTEQICSQCSLPAMATRPDGTRYCLEHETSADWLVGTSGEKKQVGDAVPDGYSEIVRSRTDIGITYEVTKNYGKWNCTCKGYQFSKETPRTCKHILATRQTWEMNYPAITAEKDKEHDADAWNAAFATREAERASIKPIKWKTEELQQLIGCDQVTKSKGIYTARKGYFYRHGFDEYKMAKKIKSVLPDAQILDKGDHWATFKGGDSIAKGSHWWVKFRLSGMPGYTHEQMDKLTNPKRKGKKSFCEMCEKTKKHCRKFSGVGYRIWICPACLKSGRKENFLPLVAAAAPMVAGKGMAVAGKVGAKAGKFAMRKAGGMASTAGDAVSDFGTTLRRKLRMDNPLMIPPGPWENPPAKDATNELFNEYLNTYYWVQEEIKKQTGKYPANRKRLDKRRAQKLFNNIEYKRLNGFEFISRLLSSLLVKHSLPNTNHRTSLTFISGILKINGIDFGFIYGKDTNKFNAFIHGSKKILKTRKTNKNYAQEHLQYVENQLNILLGNQSGKLAMIPAASFLASRIHSLSGLGYLGSDIDKYNKSTGIKRFGPWENPKFIVGTTGQIVKYKVSERESDNLAAMFTNTFDMTVDEEDITVDVFYSDGTIRGTVRCHGWGEDHGKILEVKVDKMDYIVSRIYTEKEEN